MNKDELIKKHENMAFPDFSENNELAEWIENLAELEGHLIGLVGKGEISENDINKCLRYRDELYQINVNEKDDIACLKYCKEYFEVIVSLVLIFRKN